MSLILRKKSFFRMLTNLIKEQNPVREQQLDALMNNRPLPVENETWSLEVERRLKWTYPHLEATQLSTKTSVTEISG